LHLFLHSAVQIYEFHIFIISRRIRLTIRTQHDIMKYNKIKERLYNTEEHTTIKTKTITIR